jgi:hypothetical protein
LILQNGELAQACLWLAFSGFWLIQAEAKEFRKGIVNQPTTEHEEGEKNKNCDRENQDYRS